MYELPSIFSAFSSQDASPEVIINQTEPKAQFYNISIQGLEHAVDAYTVHLISTECSAKESTGMILPPAFKTL